jgi:hypothetical protein
MSKPRVFISTDMQMLTGVNHIDGDKDDVQSLVHALMYQDKINIVGIASSTARMQPGKNDAKFINLTIKEYAKDYGKLASHGDFKTAAELSAITYQGTKTLAGASGYPSAATAGSNAIIREARAAEAAGEELYVLTWGGMGDVARALHDAPDIADSIRFISSAGQNQETHAYKYVKNNFAGQKGFWWIDVNDTLKGVYSSETKRLPPAVTLSEVEKFAKGHGALGNFFYDNSIDLRGAGDTYSGLKMGDSPGILYLIDNANNNDPTAESWGGEYVETKTNYWTDRTDAASALKYSSSKGARTIFEDRNEWLGDFKARFDWLKVGTGAPHDDPAPAKPAPTVPAPTVPAQDKVTVKIRGDSYKGNPNFVFLVDGKTIDTKNLVTADRAKGEWQTFTFTGDFDRDGSPTVGIKFNNNLNAGTGKDRNLYVDEITFNGTVNNKDAKLLGNTTKYWDFVL